MPLCRVLFLFISVVYAALFVPIQPFRPYLHPYILSCIPHFSPILVYSPLCILFSSSTFLHSLIHPSFSHLYSFIRSYASFPHLQLHTRSFPLSFPHIQSYTGLYPPAFPHLHPYIYTYPFFSPFTLLYPLLSSSFLRPLSHIRPSFKLTHRTVDFPASSSPHKSYRHFFILYLSQQHSTPSRLSRKSSRHTTATYILVSFGASLEEA